MTELSESLIAHHGIDTIHQIATRTDEVYFFIFYNDLLIYWSNNRLNIDSVYIPVSPDWQEVKMRNATALTKQQTMGNMRLLAAIPTSWNPIDQTTLANSFSYQPLIENQEKEKYFWQRAYIKTHLFYFTTITLLIAVLVVLIINLIKVKSIRNMSLRHKITYLFTLMSLVCFSYIFAMSIRYTNRRYTRQQQSTLQHKASYIQHTLQKIYSNRYDISEDMVTSLNEVLPSLAQTYRTDIHVYDTKGHIVSSSTPQLFNDGLLAPYIAPEVFLTHKRLKKNNNIYSLHDEWTQTEYINRKPYLASYTPFITNSTLPLGFIALPSFLSIDEMAQERDHFVMRLLPAYLIALMLALLLSLYSARLITAPLNRLKESMQNYKLGEKASPIDYPNNDEIGALVRQYNSLLEQVSAASLRLAQAEKESAWRTMARQVAHEINNTLTPMKLTLQQLQRTKSTERFDAYFEKSTTILIEQIDNLSRIATSFATIAKMPVVKQEKVNIAEKITNIITLHEHNEQHIPIRYIGPNDGIFALTDNEQIQQVLTNIIRNAIQVLENKTDGDIIVRLEEEQDKVHISISDNGEGIPEDIQDKIFTPNFTTKAYGTGMGLAIAKHIVQSCGGEISFQTSPAGTTFHIYLLSYFR